MKSFSIVLLLLAISSIYSSTVYKCGSDLKLDTCYLEDTENVGEDIKKTIYVDACPKGKVCNERGGPDLSLTSQCIKVKYPLEEGKKCASNSECISGKCDNDKCAAADEGGKCAQDRECKLGLYCLGETDNKTCKKYLGKDATCGDDTALCGLGLYCYDSKCTPMYSLDNGKATNIDELCKSGHSYSNNGVAQCGEVKSVGTCSNTTSRAELVLTFESDYTTTCFCPCDNYRERLERKTEWNDYVKALTEEIDDILEDEERYQYYQLNSFDYDQSFGIKKLKEKWIEYYKFDEISLASSEDDKDCVRDYYIRQLSSNKLYLSVFGILLSALALL